MAAGGVRRGRVAGRDAAPAEPLAVGRGRLPGCAVPLRGGAHGRPGRGPAAGETGFLKKGRMPAGVARQYTGTAGRVENCQVRVFLSYATPDGGRALIDRKLYIPKKWAEDRDRCRAAGIGDDVKFATKPELAEKMIGRAVKAGVPFKWATGDDAYGGNPGLREWLEKEDIPYVLAVACNAMIKTNAGAKRADELAELAPAGAWQRLSCADGSKGPRLYDWALIQTAERRPLAADPPVPAARRERRH